jgi:hypothetical protein
VRDVEWNGRIAGILAGFGAEFGRNKFLNKTWSKKEEKTLIKARTQKKTYIEIGKILNKRPNAIESKCRRLKITKDWNIYIETRKNYLNITEELLEHLDGYLLGDGSYICNQTPQKSTAYFMLGSKHKLYLIGVMIELNKLGIKFQKNSPRYQSNNKGYTFWTISSLHYVEFANQFHRWYHINHKSNKPKFIKRIPLDLKFSPSLLRNWWLGDGTKRKNKYMRICTDNFKVKEVRWLIDNFYLSYKIRTYLMYIHSNGKKYPEIEFNVASQKSFFDIIGLCPSFANAFLYKYEPSKHLLFFAILEEFILNDDYCIDRVFNRFDLTKYLRGKNIDVGSITQHLGRRTLISNCPYERISFFIIHWGTMCGLLKKINRKLIKNRYLYVTNIMVTDLFKEYLNGKLYALEDLRKNITEDKIKQSHPNLLTLERQSKPYALNLPQNSSN